MHAQTPCINYDWRVRCWEKCVVVFLDGLVSLSGVMVGAGTLSFLHHHGGDEDKEATQARLRLAEFSGGGV